mmetsp:Transcript_13550/g.17332  ORF Transcript_13550/g.17332 Transcript_13550/m.17332 type:complete len:165 (-) Transcript_13550:335-829(-)
MDIFLPFLKSSGIAISIFGTEETDTNHPNVTPHNTSYAQETTCCHAMLSFSLCFLVHSKNHARHAIITESRAITIFFRNYIIVSKMTFTVVVCLKIIITVKVIQRILSFSHDPIEFLRIHHTVTISVCFFYHFLQFFVCKVFPKLICHTLQIPERYAPGSIFIK